MNFKLALSAFAVGVVAITGCASESSDSAAAATDQDIVAAPLKIAGAYRALATQEATRWSFAGIVFEQGGRFFADVNTGIYCITTPCPTSARIDGTYSVFGHRVILTTADKSPYAGTFSGSLTSDGVLTLKNGESTTQFQTQSSYCSEASDCAEQGLIHPMCAPGGWTCSAQSTCGFSCGFDPETNAVWPADRKQLVAETRGGGFTPPPPAGSTCGLGAAKYTLDVASKKLSWEVCKLVDWSTPLTSVSGSRTLTAREVASIDAAMKDVKLSSGEICGADKPMLNISVTSASKGTKTYTDSFYSCMGGDRTYVDNIDGVFGAFRDLAE